MSVDVGTLDVTLHLGFPGSFSSLWQQAGRAGRSSQHTSSLSIIICFQCPIDQYFARHPSMLFHSPCEPVVLDINNQHILIPHLLCASKELPLNSKLICITSTGLHHVISELHLWGMNYTEALTHLVETRKVLPVSIDQHYRTSNSSSRRNSSNSSNSNSGSIINTLWRIANQSMDLLKIIGLRMIDPVSISIVDDSRGGLIIDTIGYSRAFFELYEGAIYMHRAVQYLVIKLDLPACSAHTIPVRVKYYTSASNKTLVNVIKEIDSESIYHHGDVQVVCNVYGFVKHNIGNGAVFEKVSQ